MRARVALAASLSAALLGGTAEGAGPLASDQEVIVVLAGPPEETEPMAQVLLELLGRLGVRTLLGRAEQIDPAAVLTPRADGHHPVARAWIDFRTAERVTLYVADAPWERILVRHLPR